MWVVCKTPSTLKVKCILQENLEILNRTYDHIVYSLCLLDVYDLGDFENNI